MNTRVIVVNKKVGQIPLDCIKELKNKDKTLENMPITYAGRLDPLAEGVLLFLVGNECLKKEEYLKLSKVYEVEILFGFATDTYDILGKVANCFISEFILFSGPRTRGLESVPDHENKTNSEISQLNNFVAKQFDFTSILKNFTGYFEQEYPSYSSRTVLGKPLWQWAREGRLNEIKIPTHRVFVEKIEIIDTKSYSGLELLNKIKKDINSVSGNFRQEEILKEWEEKLKKQNENVFHSVSVRVFSGGGVYMRSLANDIGKKIGVPALALGIKRISVGDYKI